VTGWSW